MSDLSDLRMGKVYYVGTHENSFRVGEPAEIIGVKNVASISKHGRPCFYIRYADGKEDLSPICDIKNYELLAEDDVKVSYRRIT